MELEILGNLSRYNPAVMVPVNLFLDDTATHISRRWNALHCAQIQISGLNKEYRQKEIFSDFVGATEKGAANTLCQSIIEDIKSCNRSSLKAYDATLGGEVVLKTDLAIVVGDFNMLAFVCNHMGSSAKKYCPKCNRCSIWSAAFVPLGVSKHLIKFILDTLPADQLEDVQLHLESLDSAQKVESSVIKNIDSRQGKDIKKLNEMQVIPFSLAFAGVRKKYLTMICLLCELHKLVHLPAYKPEDLQKMETVVKEYLQHVGIHAPALTTKVKTHLLTHMVDEIKQHGPPVSYSEDVFEKRHKAIRAKIFQQENQLARSRDTAQIFTKNIIFRHVISGGYFPVDTKWMQSSKQVQTLANSKQLKKFLGDEMDRENDRNSLAKAERTSSRKSYYRDVSEFHPASVLLQGLIDSGLSAPRLEGSMILYSAINIKNGNMLQKEDPVIYINREEEEQIGFLKGGILVIQKTRLQFARIAPCKKVEDIKIGVNSFPCVELLEVEELVPLNSIVSYIPLIHDCATGKCTRREMKIQKRSEQEIVQVMEKKLSHNKRHKLYYVNTYNLLRTREKY